MSLDSASDVEQLRGKLQQNDWRFLKAPFVNGFGGKKIIFDGSPLRNNAQLVQVPRFFPGLPLLLSRWTWC